MKLSNYLALGLMGVMLFSSCNKDIKDKHQDIDLDKTTVFTASADIKSFTLLEYRADEKVARAAIKSKGYTIPSLDITKAELKEGKYTAHWGVITGTTTERQDVDKTKILDAAPSTPPASSSLFINENNKGKNELSFYCPIPGSYANKTKKAYFAFGGNRNGEKLEFKGDFSPNKEIRGLKKDEVDNKRQIPLMTDFLPFNKILSSMTDASATKAPRVTFNPRGCLIAFCFVNKFDEDITIQDIVLENDNSLYFEGTFYMEGFNNERAVFIGVNDKDYVCPVFDGSSRGYRLSPVNGTFESKKEELPLFHVWGMPRKNTGGCGEDRLGFRVRFTKGNSTDVLTTRLFFYTLPSNNDFVEGMAYRRPVLLNEKCLPQTAGGGKNPLMYFAKYVVRKDAKGLVTNYKIPKSSNYDSWTNTDPGFFQWDKAVELFNDEDWLKDKYVFPSKEQVNSLLPIHQDGREVIQFFHLLRTFTTLEDVQIGSEPVKQYTSDFLTKYECPQYATYAIRFKGTEHESAWRFFYDPEAEDKCLVVECIGNFKNVNKTLAEIAYPSFFSTNPETTKRVLPVYGFVNRRYATGGLSNNVIQRNMYGEYWSSTSIDGVASYGMSLSPDDAYTSNFTKLDGLSVLPYLKQLPSHP